MIEAFIGIGSNLGDRVGNCLKALKKLESRSGLRILQVSSFYETEPVEPATSVPFDDAQGRRRSAHAEGSVESVEGGWFVNGVVKVETFLSPRELLNVLQGIEREMGRSLKRERGEPRTIDLDILLYDQLVVEAPDLVIPHPRMHERRFVLLPLSEIAGEAKHPVLNLTAEELLLRLKDPHQVRLLH